MFFYEGPGPGSWEAAVPQEPPMLLSRLRGEWTAIRDSAALLRRARNVPNISEQAPGTVDA
eukprot:10102351-Karenia_brevis.AAC.1